MQEGKLASAKGLEYDDALKLRNYLAGEAREYLNRLAGNSEGVSG